MILTSNKIKRQLSISNILELLSPVFHPYVLISFLMYLFIFPFALINWRFDVHCTYVLVQTWVHYDSFCIDPQRVVLNILSYMSEKCILSLFQSSSYVLRCIPYSDASLAPSVTLLALHFKSIFQLVVAYIGVPNKKL